ncbi:hypothetical protein M427DRAFT_169334 [Gonapodya prolifera JEL478]|uniref:Cytochrome b-c1 complex subunit 8 n=1 Tax=Gonapodya prolifera (strain JEL478) TaxID=1344416 RepID=A0A139B010_GONPJ|nr:hypothetical protein M427DRAFT_169334 [Gonapodya prolifera JEL478]|eukprot:KXS22304.1 hypothetical protein M427DRAFT_169334 [Gonapodya prolifera JEL478]
MGGNWGHLNNLPHMGIKSYAISPFRQRPFAGLFSKSIYNTYRRFVAQVPYIGPALLLYFAVHSYGTKEYERSIRLPNNVHVLPLSVLARSKISALP